MKKDTYNKSTLVIDRRNWAEKVMYMYTELTNKATLKDKNILMRYNNGYTNTE